MARKEIAKRQFTIYLPSEDFLDALRKKAIAYGLSLNQYILEAVESYGEEKPASAPSNYSEELQILQDRNKALNAELEDCRTKKYLAQKVQELTNMTAEVKPYDNFKNEVAAAIRTGNYWTSKRLNETFKKQITEGKDIDEALEELQELGIITETRSGWLWIR